MTERGMMMDVLKIGIGTGIAVGVGVILYAAAIRPWHVRRGATDDEVRRSLPGDDLIPDPKCGFTQAISINASPSEVWPWIVQIGYKRAGWYTHDFLHRLVGIAGSVGDELGSAKRIIPELQDLKIADVVEIAPGMGYAVTDIEQGRVLVLHSRLDAGKWETVPSGEPLPEKYLISSWTWVLEEADQETTRLIVRVRSGNSPGLLNAVSAVVANDLGSLVMQPRTLRVLKQRAEMFVR